MENFKRYVISTINTSLASFLVTFFAQLEQAMATPEGFNQTILTSIFIASITAAIRAALKFTNEYLNDQI